MKKTIDIKRSIKRIAFIDTETIGTITSPDTCLPFDISIKWYDNTTKEVLKEKCYLVRPFINNKYVMGGSFSATKYDYYLEQISTNKDYFVGSVNAIMKDIAKNNKKFGVKVASAFNDSFDKVVIERLCKEFDSINPFAKTDWLDLMEVAQELIHSKEYINFCVDNKDIGKKIDGKFISKFITPSNRVKSTAESVYCFMNSITEFQEHHTGLEDLNIEVFIYEYCREYNRNSKIMLNTPKVHWTRTPKAEVID